MIDLSTIQTFPTSEILNKDVARLQALNASLLNTNKVLRNIVIFTAITGGAAVAYVLYKNIKNDKRK